MPEAPYNGNRENEEWLAATLASIGDGVIATDDLGRVRFLNSVAEQLTGWTQAEAFGKAMVEIFPIVDETTRQPVPNPALEALSKGECMTLAENTVLIHKDGTEKAIDDSAAPIRDVNGRVSGAVLVFRDITERRRLERQLEAYRRELEAANARLAALATTDGLTNLKNRRAFQDKLTEEIKRAGRIPSPLSLLIFDVDHFKQFNDTYGHTAGDNVLRSVARLLEETARTTDFVARYGGEEFAVLLPDTDREGSVVLAERMRLAIAQHAWRERPITISVGASTLSPPEKYAALVDDADAALYESKRKGRNCVHHAAQSKLGAE